jgi:hypothetical protein
MLRVFLVRHGAQFQAGGRGRCILPPHTLKAPDIVAVLLEFGADPNELD